VDYVSSIAGLDRSEVLHEARLLVLLQAFSDKEEGGAIEGLTKLAKLDFLLRYPVMLERALAAKNRSIRDVMLEDYERHSVESAMVRYRFGPWDHGYRQYLNALIAKGLASVSVEGRKVVIAITPEGGEVAQRLAADDLFEPYVRRARLLRRHFDVTGTSLMRFVYSTFPEVVSLRSNSPIAP